MGRHSSTSSCFTSNALPSPAPPDINILGRASRTPTHTAYEPNRTQSAAIGALNPNLEYGQRNVPNPIANAVFTAAGTLAESRHAKRNATQTVSAAATALPLTNP